MKKKLNEAKSDSGSGGFIVIDLPEEQRSLFHDLLKGFEDYSKLKGYKITFSIDNSITNKVAFKFTLEESGITVSTQKVRSDIKEYIDKVKSGDDLSNLPVVISKEEHNFILATMKNRISFLQHNYNLEKNATVFYQKLLENLSSKQYGIQQLPSGFVQTGGSNSPIQYIAENSPQTIQGKSISVENSEIKIGKSFNEKKLKSMNCHNSLI